MFSPRMIFCYIFLGAALLQCNSVFKILTFGALSRPGVAAAAVIAMVIGFVAAMFFYIVGRFSFPADYDKNHLDGYAAGAIGVVAAGHAVINLFMASFVGVILFAAATAGLYVVARQHFAKARANDRKKAAELEKEKALDEEIDLEQ